MANYGVKGFSEWKSWVNNLTDKIQKEVKQTIKETSYSIEADAKQLAPVDTGFLRESIKTEIKNDGFTGEVTANAKYAIYQEFGTSTQPAHPFMTPSALKNQQKYVKEIEKIYKKAGG